MVPGAAFHGGGDRVQHMDSQLAAGAMARALVIGLALAVLPARAAVLDAHDTSRLAAINDAIQSFEDDVGSALHNLPPDAADQIESYAYVELNLEAAHERLNNIFMLMAVSGFMDAESDQLLVLDVMYGQLLPRSKNYLIIKQDAIASMAAAHPDNKVFAAYSTRANALIAEKAIPLLDEIYQRIGALRR
jgi:hypothetical protein